MPVYHVIPEQQRYLPLCLLDGNTLQLTGVLGGVGIEDIPHLSGTDILGIIVAHGRPGNVPITSEQAHLPYFLLQRHQLHDGVHTFINLFIVAPRSPGVIVGACAGTASQCDGDGSDEC